MPDLQSQQNEETGAAWRLADLIVTFRAQPPSEEVVYFARRCAAKLPGARRPMVVFVEARPDTQRVTVRGRGAGGGQTVAEDPDVFLAIRNAFDRCSTATYRAESDQPRT